VLARRPLERFLRIEAASGIVLLVVAVVALGWANSPWGTAYRALWSTALGGSIGDVALHRPLSWVVDDVLMVVFFFVVGLEIKRELHHGELSERRRALLPAVAALGGMIAPAVVYLVIVGVAEAPALRPGWGVPTATDIAFATGVLALLGRRVPAALRVLLLALAVIDDLGAIVVIAVFYSHGITWTGLVVAAAGVGGVLLLQRLGVQRARAYVVPGVVVWAGIAAAGIHPTIAGVVVGLLTPITIASDPVGGAPLIERLIARLHPWVAFVVMPVFALANAGIAIDDVTFGGTDGVAMLAAAAGLLLGKPVGIVLTCVTLTRAGIVALPRGLTLRHLIVLGVVAGIGFTMSLFVSQLAFATTTTSSSVLAATRFGVLVGSGLAAVAGVVLGRLLLPRVVDSGAAQTVDEAEASTEK
jgi:NhaA family Na+:H+ antiporter